MKKTTLIMLASASMLLASPSQVNDMKPQGMKNMQSKSANQKTCKKKPCNKKVCKQRYKNKMNKKRKNAKGMESPFLIQKGLPHLGKMIMPYMDDPAFGLSTEQKDKLTKLKATTMGVMTKLMPEVKALRKEIVEESLSGTSSDALNDKVAKLSLLQGTATMTQLKCIEETKAILTKDQLVFMLMHNKNKKWDRKKQKKKMQMRNQ